MNDSEFLNWIADRLVCKYGDDPNVDFVLRLRKMAKDAASAADTKYPFNNSVRGQMVKMPEGYIGPDGRPHEWEHISNLSDRALLTRIFNKVMRDEP